MGGSPRRERSPSQHNTQTVAQRFQTVGHEIVRKGDFAREGLQILSHDSGAGHGRRSGDKTFQGKMMLAIQRGLFKIPVNGNP
jgi:hypothetical protein